MSGPRKLPDQNINFAFGHISSRELLEGLFPQTSTNKKRNRDDVSYESDEDSKESNQKSKKQKIDLPINSIKESAIPNEKSDFFDFEFDGLNNFGIDLDTFLGTDLDQPSMPDITAQNQPVVSPTQTISSLESKNAALRKLLADSDASLNTCMLQIDSLRRERESIICRLNQKSSELHETQKKLLRFKEANFMFNEQYKSDKEAIESLQNKNATLKTEITKLRGKNPSQIAVETILQNFEFEKSSFQDQVAAKDNKIAKLEARLKKQELDNAAASNKFQKPVLPSIAQLGIFTFNQPTPGFTFTPTSLTSSSNGTPGIRGSSGNQNRS